MNGSKHNDEFINDGGIIKTKTNHSGGIQGGISNGQDIYFNVGMTNTGQFADLITFDAVVPKK